VSLSKERLSAKKKPDIRAMRDLGHREARFVPQELSNDPSNSPHFYNGISSHQQNPHAQM